MNRWIAIALAPALAAALLAGCAPAAKTPSPPVISKPATTSVQPSEAATASLPTTAAVAPKFPGAAAFSKPAVTNPWYPLTPGTTSVYHGIKDGKASVATFVVTRETTMVLGVKATVVSDVLTQDGKQVEVTTDYYAQDDTGNVWYFGESTRKADASGKLTNTEGSWKAGVNGATPGIIMPADPKVGQTFKQENFRGHAEDNFKIESLTASVTVPYGSFTGAMHTLEWTPVEPGVIDGKYYAKGVGNVAEASVQGPKETSDLVSFTK
ncbi:MAG TPA: hypothetical protein VGK50_01335 [Coriobacteriia bacterium]